MVLCTYQHKEYLVPQKKREQLESVCSNADCTEVVNPPCNESPCETMLPFVWHQKICTRKFLLMALHPKIGMQGGSRQTNCHFLIQQWCIGVPVDSVPKWVWLQVAVTSRAERQYSDDVIKGKKNGSVNGKFIQ